jgi:hypothetical protein
MTANIALTYDRPAVDRRIEIASMSDGALLDAAVRRLNEQFALVGLAERFEETVMLAAQLLGVSAVPPWRQDSRNPSRPLVETLSPEAKRQIRARWWMDFELYEIGVQLMDSAGEVIRMTEEFRAYASECATSYKERL